MIFQFTRKNKPVGTRYYVYLFSAAAIMITIIVCYLYFFQNSLAALTALIIATPALVYARITFAENKKLSHANTFLAAQQQHLLHAANNSNEGIIITDAAANIHYMNSVAEKLTGNILQHAKNRQLKEIYEVESEEKNCQYENVVLRVLKSGKAIANENNTFLKAKNQHGIFITNSCNPLYDKGQLCGTVLFFKECVPAAKNLPHHKNLIENLPQAIYTCNENGFIQSYNKAAELLWGRQPVPGIDKWCGSQNLFHPNGYPIAHQNSPIAQAIHQKKVFDAAEIIIEQPGGNMRHVIMHAAPLYNDYGNLTGAVNTMVDVTDRKKNEQVARYNEDKYYTLVEQASEAIFITDTEGNLLETNMQASIITGYTKHELKAMNIAKLFPKNDFENNFEIFREILSVNEKIRKEMTALHKNRQLLTVHISAKKLSDGRLMAIVNDVTELKQTTKSLHEAIERYQFLSQATSDTIWDWDIPNDKMLYNEGIYQMLGYPKTEVNNIRNWWKENIHPDDIKYVTEMIEGAFAAKKQNIQLEYRFKCESGIYKYIFDRAFIIYNNSNKACRMIGAMQDITYKKEDENRISKAVLDAQEAERQYLGMELHDNINQLLTGTLLMLSAASHAKMEKDDVLILAEKCKSHLTAAVDEIRNLSHRLSPAAFTTSLQHECLLLITQMGTGAGFQLTHKLNIVNEKVLPAEIKICLYRILQEQLSNIYKHSKAKKVHINLQQGNGNILLKITDDGVGFNVNGQNNGIGINNIKKRVSYFSGGFQLTAAPYLGCVVEVMLPYTPVISS